MYEDRGRRGGVGANEANFFGTRFITRKASAKQKGEVKQKRTHLGRRGRERSGGGGGGVHYIRNRGRQYDLWGSHKKTELERKRGLAIQKR